MPEMQEPRYDGNVPAQTVREMKDGKLVTRALSQDELNAAYTRSRMPRAEYEQLLGEQK